MGPFFVEGVAPIQWKIPREYHETVRRGVEFRRTVRLQSFGNAAAGTHPAVFGRIEPPVPASLREVYSNRSCLSTEIEEQTGLMRAEAAPHQEQVLFSITDHGHVFLAEG
jgi:hypothetical protein